MGCIVKAISRRFILGAVGFLASFGIARGQGVPKRENIVRRSYLNTIFEGDQDPFVTLQEAIARIPNQKDGIASWQSQTGEEYIEFYAWEYFRPGDELFAKQSAVRLVAQYLNRYFSHDSFPPKIYWRKKMEEGTCDVNRFIRYSDDGDCVEPITNRKCLMDKNWKMYTVYCRVLATHKDEIYA